MKAAYSGIHAKYYDLFYKEKDYKSEAAFIKKIVAKNGTNILELACGTGNHAFELEKLGFHINGLDYSKDMIAEAIVKKKAQNSQVIFEVADMTTLNKADNSFDNVICLFDSIGYVQTNERILKVLKSVYNSLKPGGRFIFEFWHGGAMIKSFDPTRVKRFKNGKEDVLRISETSMNIELQTCTVNYTVYVNKEENSDVSLFKESQTNRFFLCQEITNFLKQTGFKEAQFFDGFQEKEITNDTWHIVCSATK